MHLLRLSVVTLAFLVAIPNMSLSQDGPIVLAHYMPWFSSKPISGDWGWHWKLKNRNPDNMFDGKREIASHYYPLMGPYDSADPDALECHVLLMKMAGIDGVIIDWYGIDDHWDYATNHRNTLAMIKAIKKAGLKYAICYEDQTVGHLMKAGKIKSDEGIRHGEMVLQYLAENCFSDSSYVKINDRPVLLVFGPQFYDDGEMEDICSTVKPAPLLYALPHLVSRANADGAFGWPPVSGGKEIETEQWTDYLDRLYTPSDKTNRAIATVFPQFHDYYQEGEGRESFGSIASGGGETFEETLKRAWNSNSEIIQIATWNDFGEGTMIEPTLEFGYQFLSSIQKQVQLHDAKKTKFEPDSLKLPIRLYRLQKTKILKQRRDSELKEASELLFAGKWREAEKQIRQLETLD